MRELLPHYERELGFLRRYSREFAERYPKIAGSLLMSGEVCDDPHVERMIQSFALLNARISKRLDDDYPEFTEALFAVLYPHYLRPFPACSIVHMNYAALASELTVPSVLSRGTRLTSHPVRGVACQFRTAYDVTIAPLTLMQARFDAILEAPESISLPTAATAKISITIGSLSGNGMLALCSLKSLRIFLNGEPSFCATLRNAFFLRTLSAYVQAGENGRWIPLNTIPLAEVGFSETDALIEFPARSHPAYRLLTEYFAFPEKFNFVDLDLSAIASLVPQGCTQFTVHLALGGVRADSDNARMLGTLTANSMLLGCTPVINLFEQRGDPIRLTHAGAQYPVVADSRKAFAYDVYSIDSVHMVRQTPQGESITEFKPFYSLQHGQTPEKSGHYWTMRRDEMVAAKSPGYETEISIVDIDFDPAAIEVDTLSIELTCTNRDLPALLAYGLLDGDLFLDSDTTVRSITFLRKPTLPCRFEAGRGAHWRLISHLALNHLSLTKGGLDAFQETLALYDLSRSPSTQRQIGAVVAIEHGATTAWLAGNPFASLVRGIEIRMTVDEEGFVGSGLHVFASVIDRFLGLYVHANSFTQLVIFSKRTGEELLRCLPRSGDLNLV